MQRETVFHVAVMATWMSGALCALAHVQFEHLTALASGTRTDPWAELGRVALEGALLAGWVALLIAPWFAVVPTILALAMWPALESSLGTARAVAALAALVATTVAAELLVSGADWGWALGSATICGLTVGYLMWLNAVVLDRSRPSLLAGVFFPEQPEGGEGRVVPSYAGGSAPQDR